MGALASGSLLAPGHSVKTKDRPVEIAAYEVNGPLFFGAAERAIGALHSVDGRSMRSGSETRLKYR